jgi:FxsC-like protein
MAGFRDISSIPVGQPWNPAIVTALQSSAVLVCVVTPKYLQSEACGREFHLFTAHRGPSAVVLPVIWTQANLPAELAQFQFPRLNMPPLYSQEGLFFIKFRMKIGQYRNCVAEFARAIIAARNGLPAGPPPTIVRPFEELPNAFARFQNKTGPDVTTFVYAAGLRHEVPTAPPQYGDTSADWRPYYFADSKTVSEIARRIAARQSLSYREVVADDGLAAEIQRSRSRKNVTLAVADPRTLDLDRCKPVSVLDEDPWDGTAVLIPWGDGSGPSWNESFQQTVKALFPKRSTADEPYFRSPIATFSEFEAALDATLTRLRGAMTRNEANQHPPTDSGPPRLSGPSGGAAS